jgi:monovalent cation/hydrogen antiporter
VGQRPIGLDPSGHIRMSDFWQVLVFLLESVLFVLIGVQLHHLLPAIAAYPAGEVALVSGLTVAVVVGVRLLWWLAIPTLRWRPERPWFDTGGVPTAERVALGWSGLRGAISLAAALSIPAVVSGHRFPGRDLIVFTTFCVVIATLVGQGTTLPVLLRHLGIGENVVAQRQRLVAHRRSSEAALRLLDELAGADQITDEEAGSLRQRYERRIEQARLALEDQGEGPDRDGAGPRRHTLSPTTVERRLLSAQREALRKMHQQGEISFSVMRGVQRELDLEHARREG